jgi:hypothetical protein
MGEEGEAKILHNVSWEEFENILVEMTTPFSNFRL